MDNNNRMAEIRRRIESALAPESLEITDDSHLHRGHAGARDGRGHFTVKICSAAFNDLKPLQRHRLVYEAVGSMMETDIHALVIAAEAPSSDTEDQGAVE